jgi:hypothetical protein
MTERRELRTSLCHTCCFLESNRLFDASSRSHTGAPIPDYCHDATTNGS